MHPQVETIGDAYMVVGGVPEASAFHAQKVANFALDMVEKSHEVRSPATGQPIEVRAATGQSIQVRAATSPLIHVRARSGLANTGACGNGSVNTGTCRPRVSQYRCVLAKSEPVQVRADDVSASTRPCRRRVSQYRCVPATAQ